MYSKKIRFLSEEDIRRVLPMKDAVEAMKEAFRELSAGRVKMPTRTHIDIWHSVVYALLCRFFREDLRESG